jgi:NAD(P)-dependent dehydrogenase (short-subunit alcohol dehydrogenase family)
MKNFLVIGGSSGIGKAVVEELSQQHQVVATYNKTETQGGNNVNFVHYDVMNAEAAIDFIPEKLDGIVYAPGSINLKPFARIKEDDFLNDYRLQVVGAIKIIQAALPALKAAGEASIVLYSTVAVQTGFTFHSLVSASKGAIEGLTKALSAELAPSIRVNCIAPSITQTKLAAGLLNTEEKITANAQRHPLKRIGQPEDIAAATCFLLSDAAKWVTGQVWHIDGGMGAIK